MIDTALLKPCPFCGRPPVVEFLSLPWSGSVTRIGCRIDRDCHVQPSVTGGMFEQAAVKWNLRYQPVPEIVEQPDAQVSEVAA